MKAYMIAFVRVQDFESYQREYLMKAHPILTKYGGEAIVMSEKVKHIEGTMPEGKVVIVEFPSMQRAEEFYNSAEYKPLIAIRNKYTSSDTVIAENELGLNM